MYKRSISLTWGKIGDLFSLIKTAEKIQSSLTSGHVIDDVTLMTFHPKKDTVASPQTPYMLMCIAPLILKIQSNNGYVEMLHANAFLATLTVFAFIKACS